MFTNFYKKKSYISAAGSPKPFHSFEYPPFFRATTAQEPTFLSRYYGAGFPRYFVLMKVVSLPTYRAPPVQKPSAKKESWIDALDNGQTSRLLRNISCELSALDQMDDTAFKQVLQTHTNSESKNLIVDHYYMMSCVLTQETIPCAVEFALKTLKKDCQYFEVPYTPQLIGILNSYRLGSKALATASRRFEESMPSSTNSDTLSGPTRQTREETREFILGITKSLYREANLSAQRIAYKAAEDKRNAEANNAKITEYQRSLNDVSCELKIFAIAFQSNATKSRILELKSKQKVLLKKLDDCILLRSTAAAIAAKEAAARAKAEATAEKLALYSAACAATKAARAVKLAAQTAAEEAVLAEQRRNTAISTAEFNKLLQSSNAAATEAAATEAAATKASATKAAATEAAATEAAATEAAATEAAATEAAATEAAATEAAATEAAATESAATNEERIRLRNRAKSKRNRANKNKKSESLVLPV